MVSKQFHAYPATSTPYSVLNSESGVFAVVIPLGRGACEVETIDTDGHLRLEVIKCPAPNGEQWWLYAGSSILRMVITVIEPRVPDPLDLLKAPTIDTLYVHVYFKGDYYTLGPGAQFVFERTV